jgi:hypothetical protein
MTAFDPKIYRNSKDGIGGPGDDLATDTTSAWTTVALLKGIFGKVGGGSGATLAQNVAQDSTTAGQTGGLVQGAVTTAAPTYTTGKTDPLSLKTNGDLRVADTDATALLSTISGNVDGLETLVTSSNTKLDTLHTDLATLSTNTDTLEALTGALTETAPATDTASSGLNGRLQRVAQRLTSIIALVPASLGGKAAASSFAVTTATDDPPLALLGAVTETAPATDTASSGLNGRLQRVAQRITSLIALVPASLGAKTAAASFSVTTATDDLLVSQVGIVTETAPATDTASSGLNGRLQRIAQRVTSLIALVPASLGQKAMASSFAVTLASDDPLTVLASASSASITSLASAATSAQLLAANAARKGLILNNTDANTVLVKYGTTASATSFTVRIIQNAYWEMPSPIYTGRIDAIWEADGSGSLYATEM